MIRLVVPKELEEKERIKKNLKIEIEKRVRRFSRSGQLMSKKQRRKMLQNRKYALPVTHIFSKAVLTDEASDFYATRCWQALRYDTLKKYGRKCMVCFVTNVEIHVDHIKPISKFPSLALDPNNLQVLCKDCNLGKGNRDSIDWRSSSLGGGSVSK